MLTADSRGNFFFLDIQRSGCKDDSFGIVILRQKAFEMPIKNTSKPCQTLLTVSSCKNHQKYFAIKFIISLFRHAMLQAAELTHNTPTFCVKATVACNFSINSIIVTAITG